MPTGLARLSQSTSQFITGDTMSDRTLLGMLTPSSNTTLEPVTAQILNALPEASAHFGRFKVTEIALSGKALAQFDLTGILAAAELLSNARCQVIGWSGTAAGWLGFDADRHLCEAIENQTGTPACTSVLALNEIFAFSGLRRFGLVTPYRDDVQAAIVANYAKAASSASPSVIWGCKTISRSRRSQPHSCGPWSLR
jgi:maleate isomerase